jgi:hypothetical protein
MTVVGPVIEIVDVEHVPRSSEQWVMVEAGRVRVDTGAVMMDGEQVPPPPTGEQELIVIVEAGDIAQVSPAETFLVMVLASHLPQVEDPPETPPTSLELGLPP